MIDPGEAREEKQYEYLAQIATQSGMQCTVAITRLPRPGEEISEWLHEECEDSREADMPSGILYLADIDDLAMVLFTRVPLKKEKKEVPPPLPPQASPPRNLTIVVKDDDFEDSEATDENLKEGK